jgi:NADH-quinone oxidoreductase subunit N
MNMSDLGFSFSLSQLWQVAGGQIILIIAGLVLIFVDLWLSRDGKSDHVMTMGWLTALSFLVALKYMIGTEWTLNEIVVMGVFSAEKFSIFVSAVILMAGIFASLMSIGYLRNNQLARSEYFILLLFAVYGAIAMVQSVDLLMMFIALEVMSLSIYVLAAFLKNNRKSQEGALKYFLLGSFGSAFFLFGIGLMYGLTGTVNITKIAQVLSTGPLLENPGVLVAMAMLMSGLFFKMALVPFHMWTPDVYEGSPAIITGFMATAVKAGAFGIFIKLLSVTFTPILAHSGQPEFQSTVNLAALAAYWKPLLWWLALITMFVGNLVAVSQQNVKRMLAYSSIAHAGYMVLGILAANDEGRMGVLFYLFAYTLMNFGAFGVLYLLDGQEGKAQTLEDYQGLGFKYPALSFLMSLFLVSMAGLPPTAGFIGKFYLFAAAIKEGYFLLAALGILTCVIGAYYYLRVIWMLYMVEPSMEVVAGKVGAISMIALIAAALGIMYFGILPEGLAQVANVAQQSLAMVF